MKILAFDTSAKAASVALTENGKLLAEYFVNLNLTHSQTIMPMCESLLLQSRLKAEDIDVFAVSSGPGSFTGLRIGIAAVKGLAYAAGKPCAAVSTLDSLAANVSDFDGIICAVMDARCNQVYHARYRQENSRRTKLVPDTAVRLDDLLSELKSYEDSIILVGDGADLCYNKWKEDLPSLRLGGSAVRFQRAASVAFEAEKLAEMDRLVSPEELMPEYLRLPQAQRELKKRQGNPENGGNQNR